jgi:DNA-binding transcriptional ArsR family regulator
MVNYPSQPLDPVFAALADPTRRAILVRLLHGEATVTEVAEPFQTSLPAISRHIRKLEEAGLITRRKDGRTHHLGLAASPLKNAAQWLEQYQRFWESQLDSLEQFLREEGDEQTSQSR